VLLCRDERCLGDLDGDVLCAATRARFRELGLRGEVFSVKCLDLCQRGPHVVVHGARGQVPAESRAPDGGVAYDGMTLSDMTRVVDEHCANGAPLTDRLHQDSPSRSRGP